MRQKIKHLVYQLPGIRKVICRITQLEEACQKLSRQCAQLKSKNRELDWR